jgi:beta-glucosidase
MLGPGVNIYRSPRNGRNFEYFGEDPYLAGEVAAGYVIGMQSTGVSATVKHFLANNSEALRHDSDSVVEERALREIYLPAFETAVKQGHVAAVMDSYNLINGKHATENGYFNDQILRKEWGFTGTLMSDWDSTYSAFGASMGGLDLEMPTGKFMNRANLLEDVHSGKVPESVIDDKIRHILTTVFMFDWEKRDQKDISISLTDKQNDEIALRTAREGPVLLKNSGNLLPLDKNIKSVLIVGRNAYPGTAAGGGSGGSVPFHTISLLEGIKAVVGPSTTVYYDEGIAPLSQLAASTEFFTGKTGGEPGLVRESYDNAELNGNPVKEKVATINEAGVGWDVVSTGLGDIVALLSHLPKASSRRYTGYYNAQNSGNYLLALAAAGESNGDRVYVDDKLVIDDWEFVRAFEPHLTIFLNAGMHRIVVESWRKPGLPFGGRLRLAILPEEKIISKRAIQLAAKVDAIIVAAGYSSTSDATEESEGGDRTFDLPYGQDQLVTAMAKTNPKTIVTVTSGGNVDSSKWFDSISGYLQAWYGGQASGRGLAEIIFGDVNPSGHLPVTFERRAADSPSFHSYYPEGPSNQIKYIDGIFVGYRGFEKNNTAPLFPFGFGLSYTTFRFSNLKVRTGPEQCSAVVEFDVTNTGTRNGADVAQVYVTEDHPKVDRPRHELKQFDRVELAPGETKRISLSLDGRAFAYWGVSAKKWKIDPGTFTISIGDSLASLPLKSAFEISPIAVAASGF